MVGGSLLILIMYSFAWFSLTGRADVSHTTGLVIGTAVFMVATYLLINWIRELLIRLDKQG